MKSGLQIAGVKNSIPVNLLDRHEGTSRIRFTTAEPRNKALMLRPTAEQILAR